MPINRQNALETERKVFRSWSGFVNKILGALAFSLAMAALGTEAPRLFACLSAVFILAFGFSMQGRAAHRIFRLWREIEHPYVRVRVVWRHYLPFTYGWLFLGLVALGFIDKTGLSF